MVQAIIYTSNTGTTEQYAQLLSEKTGLPAYSLKEAASVASGTEIIYLGWLMAGNVKGYKNAAKLYHISALCGVGMGETGSQISDIKKANQVPHGLPIFTMRGGFDITKLHGIYKFMMSTMRKTVGEKLSAKTDRTADEDIMLDMMMNGKSYVSEENLTGILDWYAKRES